MTTTTQCLMAFVLLCGLTFAQEQQDSDPTNYRFEFKIENVEAQASDAIVKDIQTYSKDLFETHPTFFQGGFAVTTAFPVSEDRIRGYLETYGFFVTQFRMKKNGQVITSETEVQ